MLADATTAAAGAVNASQCVCRSGFVAHDGKCVCDAGWGFDAAGGACSRCDLGTFKTARSLESCSSCSSVLDDATTATPGATNASQCACRSGFAAHGGKCVCDVGYGFVEGTGTCERCTVGTFKAERARTACTACVTVLAGSTTLAASATSSDACVCETSSFYGKDESCEPCSAGMNCSKPGSSVALLRLEAGFWRAHGTDDVRACPSPDACRGGDNASNMCRAGHTGPYCAVCEGKRYANEVGVCTICDSKSVPWAGLVVLCAVAILLIGFGVCMCRSYAKSAAASRQLDDVRRLSQQVKHSEEAKRLRGDWKQLVARLKIKGKILYAFWQVTALCGTVYNVRYPGKHRCHRPTRRLRARAHDPLLLAYYY